MNTNEEKEPGSSSKTYTRGDMLFSLSILMYYKKFTGVVLVQFDKAFKK